MTGPLPSLNLEQTGVTEDQLSMSTADGLLGDASPLEGVTSTGDLEAAQVQREHLMAVLRLRRAGQIGLLTMLSFIGLDVLYCQSTRPEALGTIVIMRVLMLALFFPGVWRMSRLPLPEPKTVRRLDIWGFGSSTFILSAMSIPLGGFNAPYAAGVCVIIAFRCAFVQEPWQRALLPAIVMSLSYPVALGLGALVSDEVAAQFHEPATLVRGLVYFSNIIALSLLSMVTAHGFWLMRRQTLNRQNVGPYTLGELLGTGGSGDVHVAQKAGRSERYALKRLRPEVGNLVACFARFEREISALAKLRHSGTVRVRDYGMTEDGQLFYVMDLVEGRDLHNVIDKRGPLALGDAVCIARQVTEVLAAAQAAGITHRDVKPANIRLVGSEGHVAKLLDFGIARLDAADHTVTRWGAVVGTPSYLAPEALLRGESDARSDVYGMAATLYHALTGHPPHGKLSLAEAVAQAGKTRPAPVGKWRGEPVPAELESLLARALSPLPGERPQDCAALLSELEALPCACGC